MRQCSFVGFQLIDFKKLLRLIIHNCFKNCYLISIILFNVNHLFAYTCIVSSIPNDSKSFYSKWLNVFIWLKDGNLSDTIYPGRSGPVSNCNEGVLHIPQRLRNVVSALDGLVLYSVYSLGFYQSVEMQSVYSTAPVDRIGSKLYLNVSYIIFSLGDRVNKGYDLVN